jgi:hypothetical protein
MQQEQLVRHKSKKKKPKTEIIPPAHAIVQEETASSINKEPATTLEYPSINSIDTSERQIDKVLFGILTQSIDHLSSNR